MDFSLLGLWNQMGVVAKLVVIILLVMSMLAIGVSIERLLTLSKGPRALARIHRHPAAADWHARAACTRRWAAAELE